MSSTLPRIVLSTTFLLSLIFVKNVNAKADDILGCGGFVRSENNAELDFKQILVKLYTKSGSFKDKTECAPSGYYFLPVYDRGEYILKLEPPRGWSFEPTEIALNIDGSGKDPCSKGEDIFFTFTGFGITGKVVLAVKTNNKAQPKGISVSLYDQQNKTRLGSTVTSDDGVFSFTPIKPGKYVLVASHPTWFMDKHSTVVTVKEGNTIVKDGELKVFGFDVSGKVATTEGEPVGKVSFLLYGNGQVKNCATTPLEGFDSKKKSLCHVTSDETGRFVFPAVSPGDYTLVPYYTGSKTKFDVKPAEYQFTVNDDSLILPVEFKVTGFTITGKVLAQQIPVVGAKVYLSKKLIGTTDKNGVYKVDNVKAKQYTLYAEADDVQFEEITVTVLPSNPELPTMTPTVFKVSGKVSSSTNNYLLDRKVLLKKADDDSVRKEVVIDPNNGEWSVYLAPAKYYVSVMVSNEEKTMGLQFFPLQKIIDVKSVPLKDIFFLQLKTTLKGTIVCLSEKDTKKECDETQVTLKMIDGIVETKTVKAKDGTYVFQDVLPGQYEVIVDTDLFCWDNSKHQIVIASETPPDVIPFKQTGYSVTFISSHETKLEYSLPNQSDKKLFFQLQKGSTRFCLPISGKYSFYPKGCHRYVKSSFDWHTNERTPIILSSTEHTVSGSILSPVATEGISVKIETEGQEPLIFKNLKTLDTKGEVYKYSFSFNAVTRENYVITPKSEYLLFNPTSIKFVGTEDCQTDAVIFQAEVGKIISGSVVPPLAGVTIKIFRQDEDDSVHTLITKQDGTFRVGPLDGRIEYTVVAEKEGYVLTRDNSGKDFKFLVRKLAEIHVQVSDKADATPLQGVLISLSGGGSGHSYRKNVVTGEDGQLIVKSLSPGDYYLRLTMKEYIFEPTSQMIRVEEGKSVIVKLVGKRVAFSAYGTVTCLNGQPEAGLVVEAKGQANCAELQEEATTKTDGTWRIRGLEPKCIYAIRLKLNDKDPNSRAVRAIPSSVAVQATQDVRDIKLMALQPISRTDISVRVVTSQLENYRTLKVKLCREESPDSPIHVAKLDGQLSSKQQYLNSAGYIVHLPFQPTDGKRYFVQLDTTLSRSTHDYELNPVYFEANSSFKYAELRFDVKRKHDHSDAGQITLVPLPLIILVTLAFFKRDSLSSWLNNAVEKWSSNRRTSSASGKKAQDTAQSQNSINDSKIEEIIAEQLRNINAKTVKKSKPRKT